MLLLLRAWRAILTGDWTCFGCRCWLASLALLALLPLTRDSSVPLGHGPSIPPGHETRLSREGTSSSIPLGHGHVYPAWARGSTTPLGHEPSIPAGHEPSIPPGHESSIPRGHELVYPTWARHVCPAWALGSSIPPGHEARLSHLACGTSNGRLAAHPILALTALPGREAHALPPYLSGARHAGNRPGPVPDRPEL